MRDSKLYGRLMGTSVDGTFISCEIDSALQFQGENLPASSIESGMWSEFIYGKKSWTITVNGHLLKREAGQDFKKLYAAFFNNQVVKVQFRTRPFVDQYLIFEGNALISMGGANAPNRSVANWNITFQGSGILNMEWEEFWKIINSMPPAADQPTYIDTTDWP